MPQRLQFKGSAARGVRAREGKGENLITPPLKKSPDQHKDAAELPMAQEVDYQCRAAELAQPKTACSCASPDWRNGSLDGGKPLAKFMKPSGAMPPGKMRQN